MTPQPGDEPRPTLSFRSDRSAHPRQVPCWITRTNEATHALIRSGLDRSPMYAGRIEGGPRYCPSVEDKVVRKTRTRTNLCGTEGLSTHELYPQRHLDEPAL